MDRCLLTGLLPSEIVVVERFADPPFVDLFPQEAAVLEHAVDERRREFATVRLCARSALAQLGIPPEPLVPAGWSGTGRTPRWPSGIVGSMTHCVNYRAAAAARRDAFESLGVDAESNQPLPDGIGTAVLLPEERRMAAELAVSHPEVAWDRLMFSAKERASSRCGSP